jgi:hypothetical protein
VLALATGECQRRPNGRLAPVEVEPRQPVLRFGKVNWLSDLLFDGLANWLLPKSTWGFIVRVAIVLAVIVFVTEIGPDLAR